MKKLLFRLTFSHTFVIILTLLEVGGKRYGEFFKRLFAKEDPSVYQKKDAHLIQVLTVKFLSIRGRYDCFDFNLYSTWCCSS